MALRQDTWRLLRTTADLEDDTDWSTNTPPSGGDIATPSTSTSPINAIYVFFSQIDDEDAALDPGSATATLQLVAIADIDRDGTVDATDLVYRSAALTSVPANTEVRVDLGGALRWTVRLSSIADTDEDAVAVQVWYREVSE